MTPADVATDPTPAVTLGNLLIELHEAGPRLQEQLQTLSLYKEFAPDEFSRFEEQFLAAIGLFYKLQPPRTLYGFLIGGMGEANRTPDGAILTPVQGSIRRAMSDHQYVSISAPTSAGKSYSIRDFMLSETGDAIVIVPSRALIAEYITSLRTYFIGDKGVMILPFVDNIFTSRKLRRIFVLTPERAREVFDKTGQIDISVFFFDEAQVSEEVGRGVIFDVLVRRAKRAFPKAKMVFAHPFVQNPEAQLSKHNISGTSTYAMAYPHGAVGKISIFGHKNGRDYYFSPHHEGGAKIKNCVEHAGSFANRVLSSSLSILAYVTKASIYSGKFLDEFEPHINSLPETSSASANEIIDKIKEILGADDSEHRSKMIALMRKGVVIHHGSIPLETRFLIEEFIRKGHAKFCFATSTLAQGINMPFDVVWLNSMRMRGADEAKRSLALRNLIGRSGRLSPGKEFDYGYVYTRNPKLLAARLNQQFSLSEKSVLDADLENVAADDREVVVAIRENTFSDDLHMPLARVDRISTGDVFNAMHMVLAALYGSETSVSEALRGPENQRRRAEVRMHLRKIYEAYLGRELLAGELAVFSEAIGIMLMMFSGRSFREIAGLRFSRAAPRATSSNGTVEFMQESTDLPDASLIRPYPLFPEGTKASSVSYDVVVFDTYDYIDNVISFCLSDVFAASAKIYFERTGDQRALRFTELLRFGTNDATNILLMRYGFLADQIELVLPYISHITEENIIFSERLRTAPVELQKMLDWYQ